MAQSPIRVLTISVTSRRHALLGFASVGIILLGMVVAALPYRGHSGEAYSPLNHFISELGEIAQSQLAWAFNLGILFGGMGLGVFLLLLATRFGGRYRIALLTAGAIAGVSGALVGVLPMDYHAIHLIVSGLFFLTDWLVALIVSLWLIAALRPGLPRWLVIPGLASAAVSIAFTAIFSTYKPANPNDPILNRPDGFWNVSFMEWASLLTLLVWFVCVSIALLRERPE
jgi:hypothetical membrane protein